jgi:hypothetical protein
MLISIDTNCGTAEDTLEVKSFTWSPQVPVRGQPMTIVVQGTLKSEIATGSSIDIVAKWGLVRLPIGKIDLCRALAKAKNISYACPLAANNYDISQSFVLPDKIYDGKYTVTVRAKDQDSRQIMCALVKATFAKET